jgi:hypothetical protein
VTAIAGALALLAAGAALAVAVSAGAAPLGGLDDTTAPVSTQPAPDPAPAPKPAPKTTPKTKSTPKRSTPRRTYTAPTYTPPQSAPTQKSKPRVVRKPKRKKATKPAVTTTVPAETTPLPSVLVPVPVGARRTASHAGGEGMITSVLFIAGISFAALLFMLAATVPGTPVRFTSVGRVVIDHQQDFVLVGVAAFVITIFVYVLTGHGL